MAETIYIDTCALNRLTDDQSQPRVRLEADAMARIFDLVAAGRLIWLASTVLQFEINRNPDPVRREDNLKLLSNATNTFAPDRTTLERATSLAADGLTYFDALHLAIAEDHGADWLITTDDRFLNLARTQLKMKRPEVINPVNWIERRQTWLLPQPPPSAT